MMSKLAKIRRLEAGTSRLSSDVPDCTCKLFYFQ